MNEPAPTFRSWERWIGHIGYIAEGIIYLLVGSFALFAEFARQRQPNGSTGAFAELGATVLGKAMLALLALGVAAFVLWQAILAFVDPEHPGQRDQPRHVIVRVGHFFNGVLYCVILGQAVWRLLGLAGKDGGEGSQARWTLWAMKLPLGRYLVAAVGIGIAVFALAQFYRGLTHDKIKRVDLSKTRLRIAIEAAGAYGYLSRGVLFALVGLYLVDAAWNFDPRYSGGIAGALTALQNRPFGAWLLGAVAAGLISYGVFQISKERYRMFRNS